MYDWRNKQAIIRIRSCDSFVWNIEFFAIAGFLPTFHFEIFKSKEKLKENQTSVYP